MSDPVILLLLPWAMQTWSIDPMTFQPKREYFLRWVIRTVTLVDFVSSTIVPQCIRIC